MKPDPVWADLRRRVAASQAARLADGSAAPTRTREEEDYIRLQWQARVFAACEGQAVSRKCTPRVGVEDDGELYLSILNASKRFGVKRDTIQYAIKQGKLHTFDVGGTVPRLKYDEVKAWSLTRQRASFKVVKRRA